MNERVAIVGGTGLIGRAIATALQSAGKEVVIISRNPEGARTAVPNMTGYGHLDVPSMAGCTAVINLAGAPLMGIPTRRFREQLRSSRISTSRLVHAILEELQTDGPTVWLQGSAVGFYGPDRRDDLPLDETAAPGSDFLSKLCQEWEASSRDKLTHVRTVQLRTGLVLDPAHGGLLGALTPAYKLFLGGVIGDREAWKSWIHLDDYTQAILFLLGNTGAVDAYNLVSPSPSRNAQFFHEVGKALHRPTWLPVPEWVLRPVLRDFATALCQGPQVTPKKLQENCFTWKYPELTDALQNIYPS